jgi:hypothetical protein
MTPHRIRLGPPWVVTAAGGRARHARKFGQPRLTNPADRVWVVCEPAPGSAAVLVNGEPVGTAEPGRPFAAEVTHLLKPRNELVIEVASADPLGEVALEIRPPA